MKILVIGDTHGKLNKVRDIFPKLTQIDLIVHTGDYFRDGAALQQELNVPVIAVKGNCDGSYSKDDFEIIHTEFGNIMITHGHMEQVGYSMTNLMYKAMEQDCRAVFFGHTHRACIQESNGIHFVNPGSLSQPRDGSGGSYAIARISEDSFDASIVYYNTIMGSKKEDKQKAGYIRSLLNYSDRF
ncbi:MAG: metallophosphoesterase [Bacillota bacterium]|nr:metallophosphoesterase [Bacillota bacterium]